MLSIRFAHLCSYLVFAALVAKKLEGDRHVYSSHKLVDLLLIHSQRNPPVEWKYAQYPGSFKTCLQQMVSEGYTGACSARAFYIRI